MEEPHLIAARLALDVMSAPEMAQAARRLVLAGHWADAYVSVLESPVPRKDEVRPALVALLYETGADLPPRDEAMAMIADHITALMLSRAIDPLDAVARLMRDLMKADMWDNDTSGVWSAFAYIHYEDIEISPLPDRERIPRFAALREEGLNAARRWQEDRRNSTSP